jgi:hypothetical protein
VVKICKFINTQCIPQEIHHLAAFSKFNKKTTQGLELWLKVEHLLSKNETLSSNPSTTRKKMKNKIKRRKGQSLIAQVTVPCSSNT